MTAADSEAEKKKKKIGYLLTNSSPISIHGKEVLLYLFFGTFDQILTLVSTGERKGLLIFPTNYPEKESEQK